MSEIMNSENTSINETCYDLDEVPTPLLAIHASLIAVIITATLLGNGLILVLVARYKILRSRSVIASLSLILADMFWGLCYHFPALVSASAAGWQFGTAGCSVFGLLSIEFLLTRWLVMAVVCIDKFSTVRFPFSYEKYSKYILVVLIITAWVLPFILSFLPAIFKLSQAGFRPNIPTCLYSCEGPICRLYYGTVVSFSFIIGAIVPTILYVWLYRKARLLRPTAVVLGQMALQTANGPATNQHLPSSHFEWWSRGHLTFLLILITLILTSLPAYMMQIFRTTDYEDWCRIPIFVHFIVQLIFFLSTALDPMMIMRDQDFRRCLKHMFCCRKDNSFVMDIGYHPQDAHRTSMDLLSQTDSNGMNVELNGSSVDVGLPHGSHSLGSIHTTTPILTTQNHSLSL